MLILFTFATGRNRAEPLLGVPSRTRRGGGGYVGSHWIPGDQLSAAACNLLRQVQPLLLWTDRLFCQSSAALLPICTDRRSWHRSDLASPPAEDASVAQERALRGLIDTVKALRRADQSPHALRHALQQAMGNRTGQDRHHSRREKHVDILKDQFTALFQDLAQADSSNVQLCEWDPTLDTAREKLVGTPVQR